MKCINENIKVKNTIIINKIIITINPVSFIILLYNNC